MQSDEKILLLIQEIVKILKIEFFGFCEIKGWLKRNVTKIINVTKEKIKLWKSKAIELTIH